MTVLLLAGAMLAPLSVQLSEQAMVEIDAPEIRLADVAIVTGGSQAERVRAEQSVLARLPQGRRRMDLSRQVLGDLIRRRTGMVASHGDGTIALLRRPAERATTPSACWVAAEPVSAGSAILRDNVEAAACGDEQAAAIRYDRSTGALLALANIAVGTPLGPLAIDRLSSAAVGATITLSSRSGPVAISRPVRVLQPGRPGWAVFVQDADGAVFAAPIKPQAELRR